ncbi:hypothetical protein PBI_MEGABEAR_84 [Mycobacterium phage Megabear]|nr:hypothetical protein PBI_MEGABEAR_84 [Mycobacterium phage Megabear]
MSTSSHIMLEALEDTAHRLVSLGQLSESVFENAPKSTVFYLEPGEVWDEDDVPAIKAVGEADMQAKIMYWSRVIDGVIAEEMV